MEIVQGYSNKRYLHRIFVLLIVFAMIVSGLPQMTFAAGGDYSISFYASDPSLNKGPYKPTYDKLTPSELPPYIGGRGSNVLEHALLYASPTPSDRDGVTSLEPGDLALGQIVVFQMEIAVNGSTLPENGVIEFKAGWRTKTTSGGDFGFDPAYGVYSAFVDAGDPGSVDPGENAKVDSYSYIIANEGKNSEEIEGTFRISGLNSGDNIIVEIWMVLKDALPDKVTGNVQSRLIKAETVPETGKRSTINTGNQTIPLSQVGSFTSIEVDVGVIKTDEPDPVTAGSDLKYIIETTNYSTQNVANGVVISDKLDSNVSFVSASGGAIYDEINHTVTWPAMAIAPLETVNLELVVYVPYSVEDVFAGALPDNRGTASETALNPLPDLTNIVKIDSIISKDTNSNNHVWQEPTNVIFETQDVTVTKTWDDSYNDTDNYFNLRPSEIMVQLLQNGSDYGQPFALTANENWTKTIENLPMYDSEGVAYTYSVKEVNVPESYTAAEDGLTLRNALRRTQVEAEKVWQDFDNIYGYRPDEINVKLLRNGDDTGLTAKLETANSWKYTFMNLPEKDNSGDLYSYSVKEIDVPDNYEATHNGMTITNKLITGEITVYKSAGQNTDLNGETFFAKLSDTVNTDRIWIKPFTVGEAALFENLPLGEYRIEEVADINGTALPDNYRYDVSIDNENITINTNVRTGNATITNTLKRIDLEGSKLWQDSNNFFGLRPDTITINLYQNDDKTPFASQDVNISNAESDNVWLFKFENLPQYDSNNQEYVYSVKEQFSSTDYRISINANEITNELITAEIQLLKLDGRDAQTPLADAEFELWVPAAAVENNGVTPYQMIPGTMIPGIYLETIASGANGYAKTSGSYPAGQYYLVETKAPQGFYLLAENIIINLTSGTILQLEGAPFEVTAYNDFIYEPGISIEKSVANLSRGTAFADEATAEVGETAIYQVVVTNYGNANLVDIRLTDDQAYLGQTVTDENGNTYIFDEDENGNLYIDLAAMEAGESITLTYEYITQAGDPDRSPIENIASISATMIETPDYPNGWTGSDEDNAWLTVIPLVDIEGTKTWIDLDNLFGLRPDSITIELYQNDGLEPFRTIELDAEDADEQDDNIWVFKFNDLPRYDLTGQEYEYSIKEVFNSFHYNVLPYEGFDIANELITAEIQLLKLDSRDGETPLEGATFELWTAMTDSNGNDLMPSLLITGSMIPGIYLETITTGEDGYARTEGRYPAGQYFLVETQAPQGFMLMSESIIINLNTDTIVQLQGNSFEVTAYNDFVYEPSITIEKTVANLTSGSEHGAAADFISGETAEYIVTITNTGNTALDQVIFFDSEAVPGMTVTDQNDNEYIFSEDINGNAYIDLGTMQPQQQFILTYTYITVDADEERSPIVNIAAAEATIQAIQNENIPEYMTNPFPEGWFDRVEAAAEITVTVPPEETTTTLPTLPTIEVTTESIPLVEPTTTETLPTLPVINVVPEEIPLATPETIQVVTEQLPQSGEKAPLWPIGLAMLTIAGGMMIILNKTKKEKTKDSRVTEKHLG